MQARTHLKFIRPRTLVYAGVLGLVVAIMGGSWLLRQTTSLSVLRDRAPNFVRLSDGGVRNAYALKLGDKTRDVESYALVLDGPAGLQLVVQDATLDAAGRPVLTTRPDGISQWRALVTAPPGLKLPENVPLKFKLLDAGGRTEVGTASVFLGPKP
jgi:polyferredoxin